MSRFDQLAGVVDVVRKEQQAEHRLRVASPQGSQQNKSKPKGGKPFIAKGHDLLLERIQKADKAVFIRLISGDELTGQIKARDRYTVTVYNDASKRTTTVFKHAIETFEELKTTEQE